MVEVNMFYTLTFWLGTLIDLLLIFQMKQLSVWKCIPQLNPGPIDTPLNMFIWYSQCHMNILLSYVLVVLMSYVHWKSLLESFVPFIEKKIPNYLRSIFPSYVRKQGNWFILHCKSIDWETMWWCKDWF